MSDNSVIQELKNAIKSYPDFPKKGIIFRDFLPILQNPLLLEKLISVFENFVRQNLQKIDCIVGLESRGFLIGPPLALKLGVPFIVIRKPGKLPGAVKKLDYSLEYGSDTIEIQSDSIKENEKVLIIDDLLATGGTMAAAVGLVKSLGGIVEHCFVVMELSELNGRAKIPASVYSVLQF